MNKDYRFYNKKNYKGAFSSFCLDRIEHVDESQLIGIKNVARTEPWFSNSEDVKTSTEPEMPIALLFEAFVQAGGIFWGYQDKFIGLTPVLKQMDTFQVFQPVYPGDQLRIEISTRQIRDSELSLLARAMVSGELVAEANLVLSFAKHAMNPKIHPTASVHPTAILGHDVVIGPYTLVGEHVHIGDRTILEAHIKIEKWTRIGVDCHLHFGCVIGSTAQDIKYSGEETWVVIGDRNVLREYVTINRSTGAKTVTQLGDDNMLLTGVHVGHNCQLGNGIIMANLVNLGGHVHVEDKVTIGGMVGIHQFVRIGQAAMVGGYSRIPQDIPPFMICEGNPAYIRGLNLIGLKRRGFSKEAIQEIKGIFRLYFQSGELVKTIRAQLQDTVFNTPEAIHLANFLMAETSRGISPRNPGELAEPEA